MGLVAFWDAANMHALSTGPIRHSQRAALQIVVVTYGVTFGISAVATFQLPRKFQEAFLASFLASSFCLSILASSFGASTLASSFGATTLAAIAFATWGVVPTPFGFTSQA